jgi:long-chain acyl-CoA synthetase
MDETIPSLLFSCVDRDPDRIAYYWPDRGHWRACRWGDSLGEIAAIARGLSALGVGPGAPVAVLSETRREWTAVDFAILSLGAITVGVYPSLTAEQAAYQLEHSEARVVIVEDAAQAAKVASQRHRLPRVAHVLSMEPVPGLSALPPAPAEGDVAWLRTTAAQIRPDDVATYIYTSGTTGNPKGAVLSHRNFTAVIRASQVITEVRAGDRSLIFLPLAHSLQRFALYRGLLEDAVGYYVDGLAQVPEALQVARPTILASVPRMLEKIRDKALATAEAKGGAAHRIFRWALGVGRRRALHLEAAAASGAAPGPLPVGLRLKVAIADRLVFSRVRAKMGGELRTLVSGGAALDPEVARFYLGMGIEVLEGWGLTETSAPATANRQGAYRLGTVGQAIPGVEIRLDTDGEVLVRGPGIFGGYLKDPEATASAMTDGWFRTGDIGTLDADGFLRITDRKKEILVTAGGKNIAPVNLEKRLERSPYVSQAVAIGDGRPYLVALLVPDLEALSAFAHTRGFPDEPLADRLRRPEVRALFATAVDDANRELAKFESIKRFEVLPTVFSVESGEMTPTLKLKRRVVRDRWSDAIDRLYR